MSPIKKKLPTCVNIIEFAEAVGSFTLMLIDIQGDLYSV